MTSGKAEKQASSSSASLNKKQDSLNLARLIIACNEKKPIINTPKSQDDVELVRLIQEKSTSELAYWLSFHSFIKYQLKTIIKVTEVDMKNPSPELVEKVNTVLRAS